ncbi:MAG TPA: hypothetical protein PLM71_11710 [Syntrophorhabdaceae bacterium]|nr:hypothetical protein [Syntrophorhabdaceae bacterium]HPU30960.1 hypothetical protein [Syntrophorhabdaceae bacterium]
MNEERDKFLTELMNQCWHDYDKDKPINTYSLEAYICKKCKGFILGNNDFSQEEDFMRLYTWAKTQKVLKETIEKYDEQNFHDKENGKFYREKFADSVYTIFKQTKDNE